jgi:hypothetical protein
VFYLTAFSDFESDIRMQQRDWIKVQRAREEKVTEGTKKEKQVALFKRNWKLDG